MVSLGAGVGGLNVRLLSIIERQHGECPQPGIINNCMGVTL
jgi:hypothetical protein